MTYDERTIDYTYDALSRLLEADYDSGTTVYNYGFDLAGNMTNLDGVTRTYNAANQLTNDGTNALAYDANGNLWKANTVEQYTWDRANRLLSHGGIDYVYEGQGNRIAQDNGTDVTQYLLDVQPGLAVVLAATTGANTERYLHGIRGIHAQENQAGSWTWMAQDGLGSVRSIIDSTLQVDAVQSYDPIGNPAGSYTPGFGFTGEQTDANGQVYLRTRYYNPSIGIFNSLDSFEGRSCKPMSLNGYSWVEGNPINLTDANGKAPCMQDGQCEELLRLPGFSREVLRELGCLSPLPTPPPTSTPSGLDECDQRYLAHISAGESKGTNSNIVVAAIMLAQINAYNAAGGFYPFRVIETFLEKFNREELIGLYYQNQPAPESNEELITQSQSYSTYRSLCLAGTLATADFENYGLALQMAQQMSDVTNPLGNYNVTNITAGLRTVASSPNLQQENSFCSSVLEKIPDWQQRATAIGLQSSPYIPAWYPSDDNHIVFEGTPRSVIIYSGDGSPIHRSWQCPQFEGQPTVHLRGDGICVQCNNGTEAFSNGIYQSCEGENASENVLGDPITACQ